MSRVLIVQNYWTPYRSDLFKKLSLLVDLDVLYLGQIGSDRRWSEEEVPFNVLKVPFKKKGPFLFSDVSGIDFSVYGKLVILEHLENIFTILNIVRRFNGPYYLWCGMFNNMYPDKRLYGKAVDLFKRVYRKRLYRAEGYFAYSTLTREMLTDWKVPEDKITIIHQASRVFMIPEVKENDPVSHRSNRKGPLMVLSLGYLRKEKNNDFLIRVCSRFSKDELILTIVGDGPEKENLVSTAPENVIFKDYMDGEEKFREYLESDLFVLPTIRDPWALTVNEAMAYGLPVVCSSRAGAKDLIDGNGIIFDPFNEDSLYNALNKYVKDRGRCIIEGKRSMEIIKDYSIEFAAEQISGLLNR